MRMPWRAYSSAAALVMPATPCLAAVYAGTRMAPVSPMMDEVLTMAPLPCLSICVISAFMHSHTPVKLTASTWFQSSSLHSCVSTLLPPMPALLNAQSSRPYVSTALATIVSTSCDFDTSVLTKIASAPLSLTIVNVSWPPASTTSASTRLAPSRTKILAVARPMPEPAPVISAILPSNIPGTMQSSFSIDISHITLRVLLRQLHLQCGMLVCRAKEGQS